MKNTKISEEEKDKRRKEVEIAYGIASLSDTKPSEFCVGLCQDYIDGKATVTENKEKLIEYYRRKNNE